jgi:hypothetical protein
MSAGTVIAGAVVSTTLTLKVVDRDANEVELLRRRVPYLWGTLL